MVEYKGGRHRGDCMGLKKRSGKQYEVPKVE